LGSLQAPPLSSSASLVDRQDQPCDFVGGIDLDVVPSVAKEEELGTREDAMKSLGHSDVQIRVGRAEDDPHRRNELTRLRGPLPARAPDSNVVDTATDARDLIDLRQAPGAAYIITILVLFTGVVSMIVVHTMPVAARGRLFPEVR
jgi:hypothetical protein